MTQNLNYYDVTLSLPFLDQSETTKLKIPCFNLHQAFKYLEDIHLLNLDSVIEVHIYKVSKVRGNTRIDFKLIQVIQGQQLQGYKLGYKRKRK
jgi:hypothetical protein